MMIKKRFQNKIYYCLNSTHKIQCWIHKNIPNRLYYRIIGCTGYHFDHSLQYCWSKHIKNDTFKWLLENKLIFKTKIECHAHELMDL